MSSAPPPPANQWEELNRPRSERTPPPPAPAPAPQPPAFEQPGGDKKRGGIDPFVLVGIGAVAFVVLAGGLMVLGGFVGSSDDEREAAPTETTSTSAADGIEPAVEESTTTVITEVADTPFPAFDVPPDLSREEAAVFRLYLLIFGREPDASGLEYWSGELANGTPLGVMAQQLMSTDEFVAEYGERPSQEELVDLVHVRIYGRPATDQERAFWEGLGIEGIEFLIAFSNSPEVREALGTE